MRGTGLRLVALLAALVLVAAACGDDGDAEDGAADTEETTTTEGEGDDGAAAQRGNVDGVLKLGSVLPSTGDLAVLGEPMNRAVDMALRDINEAGGVLGEDVQLVAEDSGTNEDVANSAVDRLIGPEQVDAVIGAASSRISLSVIDKITGAEVVQCSPSNTGLDFTTYEDGGYYFRTAPPDNLQGQVLSDAITGDGHETVAVMNLADAYGQGFADSLADSLTEAGAEVVAEVPYDPQGTNFDADVDQIVGASPDAVALIAFPETGAVIVQTMIEKGVGPDDVAHYYTDGLQSGTLAENVDPSDPAVLDGVRGTAPSASPPSGADFFPEQFSEFAPGVDTIFSAHAYDCTVITALATVAAGSDASPDIQSEMNAVTRDGTQCVGFVECRDLLEAGEDIDYQGASGALDFVDAGEPGVGEYDLWHFDAEGAVVVDETVQITGTPGAA